MQAGEVRLVSRTMVNTLLGDPAFLATFPEFAQMAGVLKQAAAPSRSGGCGSCRKRRIEYTAFNDFISVLKGLAAQRLGALKQRIGVSGLMFSVQDTRTGRYVNGSL